MRNRRVLSKGLKVLAGASWWLLAHGAAAADLNALKDVQVSATPTGAQVVVTGSQSPIFTVFRLSDPDRLVVDVTSADGTAVKGVRDGIGPVGGVVISQFSDEHGNVARFLVVLKQALSYDVRADGTRVLILVKGGAAAPPATAATPAASAPALASAGLQSPAPSSPPAPAPAAAAAPTPLSTEPVLAEHDARSVKHPARHLTQVHLSTNRLELVADGPLARYEVLELQGPLRLALDVYGVTLTAKLPTGRPEPFASLRSGAHTDKVRLVLDVGSQMPIHAVTWTAHGLVWTVGGPAASPAVAKAAKKELRDGEVEIDGKPVAAAAASASRALATTGEIQDVSFTELPGGGRVDIKLTGEVAWSVERPEPRGATLTLKGAKLPRRLERSLDTSALETPLKMISTFAVPGDANLVRVVVAGDKPLEEKLERTASGLSWRFTSKGSEVEEVAVADRAAGFTSEAKAYAAHGAPDRTTPAARCPSSSKTSTSTTCCASSPR
jgi:type IV pilus assembly protein PilQ